MQRNYSVLLLNLGLHYPVSLIGAVIKILRDAKINSKKGKELRTVTRKLFGSQQLSYASTKHETLAAWGERFFTLQVCLMKTNTTNKGYLNNVLRTLKGVFL